MVLSFIFFLFIIHIFLSIDILWTNIYPSDIPLQLQLQNLTLYFTFWYLYFFFILWYETKNKDIFGLFYYKYSTHGACLCFSICLAYLFLLFLIGDMWIQKPTFFLPYFKPFWTQFIYRNETSMMYPSLEILVRFYSFILVFSFCIAIYYLFKLIKEFLEIKQLNNIEENDTSPRESLSPPQRPRLSSRNLHLFVTNNAYTVDVPGPSSPDPQPPPLIL